MSYASNTLDMVSYFFGKVLRFVFFGLFIISLFRFTSSVAGFSKYEALLVFLTFNIVDTIAQVFFRGIYVFKSDVRRGFFDYVLVKPVNALFHTFSRLPDVVDLLLLVPLVLITVGVIWRLPGVVTGAQVLAYFATIILAVIMAFSFHVLMASFMLWMEEGDSAIWLYRDVFAMGRFPTEIFPPWLQIILTVTIPVTLMVGVPVKALLGVLDWAWLVAAVGGTVLFMFLALWAWRASLRYYTSASS